MRDAQTLRDMEEIAVLWQYLYMDENHTVEVKNSIGVPLQFRMNEDGYVLQKNLNFPNVPEHTEELALPVWLAVIDQLKGQPLKEMAGWQVGPNIRNRWDEITLLTKTNMSLNRGR